MAPTTLTGADVVRRLEAAGVAAVLVVDDADYAVPVARALVAGGITAVELTLRTPAAVDAARAVLHDVPEMLVGIGTVLTPAQVRQAKELGAHFAMAPGLNARVVMAARDAGLFFTPGVATPSEVERAVELGCQVLKFFPAEAQGGIAYLKGLAAPYLHLGLRYIPLGGVTPANVETYLRERFVLAVGGSWLAPRQHIAARDWKGIEAAARAAVHQVNALRGALS